MTPSFDPAVYVTTPVIGVASGFALGSALIAACPKNAPAEVKKAAKQLRSRVIALQTEWAKRNQVGTPMDRRASDQALDNGWAAMYGRLDSFGWLPSDHYPEAERARMIKNQVFPDGLTFLKLPYAEEWAESEKLLAVIETNGLAKDIDRIAGPEFLKEVRRTHALYGEALGITKPAQVTPEVKLQEPLRRVQLGILRYALKVAALADEDDPPSIDLVRAALRPIDEFRAAQARRAAGTPEPEPEVTPTTPVPEVPGTPAKTPA